MPSSTRAATDRISRVEDQTDEQAREIRDVEREVLVLGGKVDALRVGIEAHERLNADRDGTTRASFARLEAGHVALVKAVTDLHADRIAAHGEAHTTQRERIKAWAQVAGAAIAAVVTISGIVYGITQAQPPPVPGTAYQQDTIPAAP